MKKLIFTFIILFSLSIKAQLSCGTPQTGVVQGYRDINNTNYSSFPICINVQFHIVKESNGTGGVTDDFVNQIVTLMNTKFNPHNIYIRKAGVDLINNSTYYNSMDNNQFNNIITVNNNPNAINFYLVNNVISGWAGRAEKIESKNLVMMNSYAQTGVAMHELGHCLNMWHTFNGSAYQAPAGSCAEAINGSNCNTCGDYVCDTPADAGPVIGATQGYNPDMTNIMSYSPPYMLDHFTNMQGVRMRDALNGSTLLQSIRSNQCGGISGASVICQSTNSVFAMSNPMNASVSWSVSSNLSIVSSSNTSIIVKSASSTTNGMGTITAVMNGMTYSLDIWIGKPLMQFQLTSNSNYVSVKIVSVDGTNISLQGITSINWKQIGTTNSGNANGSGFVGLGHGPNFNWTSTMQITSTNACGTAVYTGVITPAVPLPCKPTYKLVQTERNKYTSRIIQPCVSSSKIGISSEVEVVSAELYNSQGSKISQFSTNDFDLNLYPKGYYILNLIVNGNKVSEKIIIK